MSRPRPPSCCRRTCRDRRSSRLSTISTRLRSPPTGNQLARRIVARLVIAGDDQGAKAAVTRLLDQFGFDTVDAGPLKEGWRIQRDTPGYGPRRTAEGLRKDLAAAKRYADK